jgi:molecular chaperone GrpE
MTKNLKIKTKDSNNLKNQLARALADYDNLRKRTEAEKSVWLKFAKQDLLIKLLPVLDTLENAQKHLKDEGLVMTINQFQDILREEGIVEIPADKFDAELHEVVDTVPGGEKDRIAEVLLKGYKFNDETVIRHAKVRVYQGGKN